MHATPITTITFFEFKGFFAKFWAFSRMGIVPFQWARLRQPVFFKLLGTGSNNGFAARPDFSKYGLLAVWDSEATARVFFANNPVFQSYLRRSVSHRVIFLHNTMSHGYWSGQQPFVKTTDFDPNAPVAVLTRATIRTRRLFQFWRRVAPVSRSMEGQQGLLFAVGIGELPWIQQATFSLWASGKQMMDYAYKGALHSDVIKKTREMGWYKEEMFARFVPYRIEENGHEITGF
jgi:hypothetical protein